jgi:putative MATE family efflux protein
MTMQPAAASRAAVDVPEAGARSIWSLAWPIMLGNISQALVGLIDVIAIGSHGPAATAAVASGVRLVIFVQAGFVAVTAGTAALVARYWGAGNRARAASITTSSMLIACVISLVFAALCAIFSSSISSGFGLRGVAAELGTTYLRLSALTLLAFPLVFVPFVALRAAGDTRTPLAIGIAMHATNIALLLVLVPRFSVVGTALANTAAFLVAGLSTITLWVRGRLCIDPPRWPQISVADVRTILSIGYRGGVESAVWHSGLLLLIAILGNFYGPAELAAYSVGLNVLAFSVFVGMGIGVAAGTTVGQRLGASDPVGATHAGWSAVRLALTCMGLAGVVLVAASDLIARLIMPDPEVARLAGTFLFILGLLQPLMAVDFALSGALRGAGDTRFPLIATITGLLVARIGLALTLAAARMPVEYVYGVLGVDYLIKATMLTVRFRSARWRAIIRV